MKVLHYAGQQVVTGDDIATVVLDYARALALANRSDILLVPTVDDDLLVNAREFLIGPASQIVTSDADPFPRDELISQAFVADVRARMLALTDHSHPVDDADYLNADAGDNLLNGT